LRTRWFKSDSILTTSKQHIQSLMIVKFMKLRSLPKR